MDNTLVRNWWALLVRGLLAIAFGLLAWAWPVKTAFIIVLLFGGYAFADGIFALVSAFRARRREGRWWPVALEGVLGIAAGLVAFLRPGLAALGLVIVIAAWALSTGVMELIAAVRLRKHIKGEWLLALSGVLSIALGVVLLINPAAGILAMTWVIAAYAIAYGAVMIGLSIRLKRAERPARPAAGPAPQPI